MIKKCLPAALLGLVAATPAFSIEIENVTKASSFVEDTGSIERNSSAEKLRTYSQEVAAASCFLYNDIDPALSAELVLEARVGFDRHLSALLNGDDTLGIIGGERRRKTIAKLESIQKDWTKLAVSIDALLENPKDDAAIAAIKAANLPLFGKTDILVSELEGQYSDPAVLMQVDVIMLEIVGRQAMMTQKIAKNACKIWTGNDQQQIKDDLAKSMDIYEASLNALLNGMPELGIRPAPTREIETKLTTVLTAWKGVRPKFETLLAGAEIPVESQGKLFKHMIEEMKLLEEVTDHYVTFAKH
ncbi:MAG: type IV pili methyl-accepting chemotaxis transducer N-terminal domain-containing protein [Pseudomonadota bacterium]